MPELRRRTDTSRAPVLIGLLADPDLPAELAKHLEDALPRALAQADGARDWQATVHVVPLVVGHVGDEEPLLRAISERKTAEGWDVAVGLTDLPRRAGTRAVVADLDPGRGVALTSVPALGVLRLPHRARDVVVRLVLELLGTPAASPAAAAGLAVLGDEAASGQRLVLPALLGSSRLFAGMVRANRPWRLVGALSGALLAAFAASVFGVFTETLWLLADRLGAVRLSVITVLSVAAMVVYLISRHGLWERPETPSQRRLARLYNVTTAATLALGVLVFYVALLAVMTVTVVFLVDSAVLGRDLGHPPSWADYLDISWLIASLATVGGALGSGAEDADTVRRAAYGARQRARSEQGACHDAPPDGSD
ncbi:MAG: hypothetical protein ACXVGD_16810 [Blastococcus sp.]